jgi:hypothetical protein
MRGGQTLNGVLLHHERALALIDPCEVAGKDRRAEEMLFGNKAAMPNRWGCHEPPFIQEVDR